PRAPTRGVRARRARHLGAAGDLLGRDPVGDRGDRRAGGAHDGGVRARVPSAQHHLTTALKCAGGYPRRRTRYATAVACSGVWPAARASWLISTTFGPKRSQRLSPAPFTA